MILQFGAGNFLRWFADLFVDYLNASSATDLGPIIVIQSTGADRADALNRAGGVYHLAIQGYRDGKVVDETRRVGAISHVLHAGTQWEKVLAAAGDPALRAILSNTTEAGLALDEADLAPGTEAPLSFPAKLLVVLMTRRATGLQGPWIVPCELIEANGDQLRELVLEQAARWALPAEIGDWIAKECRWVNTLVDRIVP